MILTGLTAPALAAEPYMGVLSDGHGHLKGEKAATDKTIEAMDRNNIDKVVVWVKHQGGWTDDDTLDYWQRFPDRVVPGIAFQNKGWTKARKKFLKDVRKKAKSGKFRWMGEMSMRGKIGGNLNAPSDDPRIRKVLDIAIEFNMPLSVHHNPYKQTADGWQRTDEFETFVDKSLSPRPDATVIWEHWCGQSTPADIRKLFARLPNLHCSLAWIHFPPDEAINHPLDSDGNLTADWVALIEDFPDRFIAGVDSSATPNNIRDYDRRVAVIRKALGGLSPAVAAKVATENFHRLATMAGR
ncbi:MAG: amidohydrolase family protein [Alphaproteobacteria bacterium]